MTEDPAPEHPQPTSAPEASESSEVAVTPDAPGEARPIRRYEAAVSAGAMASAWANQEQAPTGATVVVSHEVSPLGRLSQLWPVPALSTLAFAVVLRPRLSTEEADVPWRVARLAVADGIEAAGGPKVTVAWPDQVLEVETGRTVAGLRADVQLGPGKVRVAVATVRIDLSGDLGDRRQELLDAIGTEMDQRTTELDEGVAGPLAAYEKRCSTLAHNVKIRLIPRGELRGRAAAIDPLARLELRSPTSMVERVSVNQVRSVEVL